MSYSGLLFGTVVLLVPGLVGVFVPIVPGVPYMFFIALLFGLIDRFSHLTVPEIGFLALVAFISVVIDHASGLVGGKLGGASKTALTYGLLGSIIGFMVLPPFGTVVGLFLGVLVGGLISGQTHPKAVQAATKSVLGSVAGMGINLVLGITFMALFILFALH